MLAAKIPLIGKIFEKVEEDATYSGDFSDKKTVLTKEDAAGNLDTSDYTVSDKGITLTASEAYCDGYSIFLTVNIESEDADFTHIPRHYTGMNIADDKTAAGFYIDGKWRVDGRSDEWLENTFDGEVIDSHTFAGMLKINLAKKHAGSGELSLTVNGLGYDDDTMIGGEEISASHWTEGSWNITIPFEVNETDVKTIEVGEKKGNITLEDVVVSPYQVIVHAGWSYEPCSTICFNQDGEMLHPDMEMAGRAVFAVQGKEIKTLYVYIFDNPDDWSLMAQEGMNSSIADRAVISKEIYVE